MCRHIEDRYESRAPPQQAEVVEAPSVEMEEPSENAATHHEFVPEKKDVVW